MFHSKSKKIMSTPVNLSSTIYKWGWMGYKLHGRVIMMVQILGNLEKFA